MDAADAQGPEVVAGAGAEEVIETGTGTGIETETGIEAEIETGTGTEIVTEIVTETGIEMNEGEVVVEVAAEEAVHTEGVGMDRNAITVAVITTLDLIC